jgi:hypothetical protein
VQVWLEKRAIVQTAVAHEPDEAPKTAKHIANGLGIVRAGLKTLLRK